MKRYIWIVCAFLCSIIAASAVGAGDFDGTRPLLISVIRVVECTPDGTCREVTPASVELSQFLKIDFIKKTIRPAAADDKRPATVCLFYTSDAADDLPLLDLGGRRSTKH